MDDLPELPFEQVLSYLSLEDRLKSRGVSRVWRHMIDRFRVKSLCYSLRPRGFISEKDRWVSDAFAQNFIGSTRFEWFFNTFGPTILSNLKHLRLCDLRFDAVNSASIARILQSFGLLEQLDLIEVKIPKKELELNLPLLNGIHLESVRSLSKLTLDAPRLQEVKVVNCSSLRLDLVHTESVERLLIDYLNNMEVKKLKNLRHLYTSCDSSRIDSTLLSSLEHLREFHLNHQRDVSELFEQKRRNGRADLKIFYRGLLLNGPDDPAMSSDEALLRCLAENPSRLADEIPFWHELDYSTIESVAPGSEINVLKRFTDLNAIDVNAPVRDVQRFLDLLKNFNNVVYLDFSCDQPQDLFYRLPEHSAVQVLYISSAVTDFQFLFRLKHLIRLYLCCSIDAESVRKILEELQFLSRFEFQCNNKGFTIVIGHSKEFEITFIGKRTNVPDLNSAIQVIIDNTRK